jgi:CDP-2,3-bis-(O-geranylgeranyl)-sn-glycerol synthase
MASDMLVFVLKCWYLMLPGLLSNLMPPLVKRVPFLDSPLDLGLKWHGKELLGSHKTFRGFFFGVLVAIIIVFAQKILFENYAWFQTASLLDYSQHSFLLVGFLMGFGALFGDAVKSALKRRLDIKPGRPWIPFDQMDFVIGWILFTAIVYVPSWQIAVTLLITVPVLHIATNHVGYYIGVNKVKW